ncbi:hypothetical protein J6590_045135 [Homalodisca vitripennis]|nr:hypothetical protein J6590_045135 [Homalodisca vitripennis]
MLGHEINVNGTCTALYRDKQQKVAHSATSVCLAIVTSEKILFPITVLTAMSSSSDDEAAYRRKRRREREYLADLFDTLSTSHQEDFILNVTDDMGTNSEIGGDSEADDYIDTTRTPSFLRTSTPMSLMNVSHQHLVIQVGLDLLPILNNSKVTMTQMISSTITMLTLRTP